ncbi:MAG: GNAT family N-acetyltransferase [Reyranellaceae bacterium]
MANDTTTQDPALRRAVAADAALVQAVTRAAYAKWVPLIGREPLPMRADYEVAVRDHWVDLLEVAGEVVALIETVPAADHLLIENVAVMPGSQERGHGTRLMAHAEGLARELGVGEMRLYTNRVFAGNVALYLRLGYRIDREEPIQGGVAVYMSKRLG